MKLCIAVKLLLLSALLLNVSCSYSYDYCPLATVVTLGIGPGMILMSAVFFASSFFHITPERNSADCIDRQVESRLYAIKKHDEKDVPVVDLEKQVIEDRDTFMRRSGFVCGSTGVLMILSGLTAAIMNNC